MAHVLQLRPDPPRPAAGDVLELHLADLRLRGLREPTITSRRYSVRRVERAVGLPLLEMTPEVLDDWQRRRAAEVSDRLRAQEVTHLQQTLRWALKRGYIAADPSGDLVQPRVPRGMPRPIGEDDLASAIAGAPERIRPWLVLAAYTGLRACEIASLERSDVLDDAEPPALIVRVGKGGKQRVVPLSLIVVDALRRHGLPPSGAVFRRGDGQPGPNSPARLSHIANDYLHAVGVTASLHQLRHRFGTVLYRATQDIRLVQEALGHQDPATTALYTAYSTRHAFAAVAAMGADPAPTGATQRGSGRRWHSADRALRRPLTRREGEVARLLAAGRTRAQVAAELGLGRGTVKQYAGTVMVKLGVSSEGDIAGALGPAGPRAVS